MNAEWKTAAFRFPFIIHHSAFIIHRSSFLFLLLFALRLPISQRDSGLKRAGRLSLLTVARAVAELKAQWAVSYELMS